MYISFITTHQSHDWTTDLCPHMYACKKIDPIYLGNAIAIIHLYSTDKDSV